MPGRPSGGGPRDDKIRRFEDPLDAWLTKELGKLYGSIADEPLPPAILALLRACEERLEAGTAPEPVEP